MEVPVKKTKTLLRRGKKINLDLVRARITFEQRITNFFYFQSI